MRRNLISTGSIRPRMHSSFITLLSFFVAIGCGLAPSISEAHPFDVAVVKISLTKQAVEGSVSFAAGSSADSTNDSSADNSALIQTDLSSVAIQELALGLIGELSFGEREAVKCLARVRSDLSPAQILEDLAQAKSISFDLDCQGRWLVASDLERVTIRRNPRLISQQAISQRSPDATTIFIFERGLERFATTLKRDDTIRVVNLTTDGIFKQTISLGIEHIGASLNQWGLAADKSELASQNDSWAAWAIPEGIDHILFILTLVLVAPAPLNLFKAVTGFTLGHSVTLALATIFKAVLAPEIVEPAIAASIACMAFEAARRVPLRRAWIPATVFGALHGCGFARALIERGLEGSSLLVGLLGFNIGVELGQLVFVVIFSFILFLSARIFGSLKLVTVAFAYCVLVIASYWFVERIGLVP